jgi:hypothetical protein
VTESTGESYENIASPVPMTPASCKRVVIAAPSKVVAGRQINAVTAVQEEEAHIAGPKKSVGVASSTPKLKPLIVSE